VKNNDVIIGRTGKVHEVGPDGELREVRRDRSVVLHCDPSEMHVIDAVVITENKDGNRLVRVTTRSTRKLQCGDKVSLNDLIVFKGKVAVNRKYRWPHCFTLTTTEIVHDFCKPFHFFL
jgi:hypothetical protein